MCNDAPGRQVGVGSFRIRTQSKPPELLLTLDVVVISIHWCLPGFWSHVAVTVSYSLDADLIGCQSQNQRKEGMGN